MFLRNDPRRRSYIRQTGACRPCTHKNTLLTFVGGAAHNHKYAVGQRIVRNAIRRDSLFFYYRTGRFHCIVT